MRWEFESPPMGGSQRCQDWCQSLTLCCTQHPPTCENIETFWHQTRSHSPPISTFAANTSLSMLPLLLAACCYPLLFWTFQRRFDFWEVAAPFLGQLAHFMNHNTLYRLPPLHCCQPIWGCATAGGGGLGGGVGGGDDGGDRLDENKSGREQWWCLFPGTDWSAAFPFFSSLPVFVVTCSCSKYNADRNRDKTLKNYIYSSEYYSHFCSNIYKEMSVTHIQCWFLTCVATYRLFWCSQCAYVADYPGLHIATNQMCWTSW